MKLIFLKAYEVIPSIAKTAHEETPNKVNNNNNNNNNNNYAIFFLLLLILSSSLLLLLILLLLILCFVEPFHTKKLRVLMIIVLMIIVLIIIPVGFINIVCSPYQMGISSSVSH